MSQEGIVDVLGTHPVIPTEFIADSGSAVPISNQLEVLGETVAAGSNPFRSIASGNTVTYQAQISQAIAATDATAIGLAAFSSADFSVDANGFVQLSATAGGTSFTVDAASAPGTNPVAPSGAGLVTVTGGQVAAGTTSNVIQTNSLAANSYTVQVQRSKTEATATVGSNGVCHFDSASFSVDSDAFVSLVGSIPNQFDGNSGSATPSSGVLNIVGSNGVITSASGSTVTAEMNSPFTGAFTFTGVVTSESSFNVNPGSDIDTDLVTVQVTGTPTLSWVEASNYFQMTDGLRVEDNFIAGDPGVEGSGITIDGGTFDSVAKVSDIGGTNAAQFILHRHSTTLSPLIVAARANSDTSSHAVVTNGMSLLQLYGAGWAGSEYQLGASISMEVDGATISDTSMPGRIVFNTTPSGSITPVEALRISQDKQIKISNAYTLPISDGSANQVLTTNGSGTVSFQDTAQTYTWNVVTGTTQAMTAFNAYFANNASGVTLTLPSSAAVGDRFEVCAMDAAGFTIDYNTGQYIRLGTNLSTTTSGSVVSANIGDWIEIVCNVANTGFMANLKQGNEITVN